MHYKFIYYYYYYYYYRPHSLYAVHRCGLLLQMTHVVWSVCLWVGHTGELCKSSRTDRDAVWGLTHVGSRIHVLDRGSDAPREMALLRGHVLAHCNVPYRLRMCLPSAHSRRIHSPPRGDVTTRRCGLLSNYIGNLLSFTTRCALLYRSRNWC